MKNIKILILVSSFIFIFSCQGAKDAIQGKKRSQSSDEFLVEKKNPLIMPPDIEELPVPLDKEEAKGEGKTNQIKELITNNEDSSDSSQSNSNKSIEKSILEKIKN